MSSGSLNIDINGHQNFNLDRFILNYAGASASLAGGTINLNYLSGYTPSFGDSMRLITVPATGSVTLDANAVTIDSAGDYGGTWTVQTVGTTDIRLVYIPEPGSCVLAAISLIVGMSGFRRRS